MMNDLLALLNHVVSAHPQEWPTLLPALEYLFHTAPQGAHGLSARDISCGYSILSNVDKRLLPFQVPRGLPESDLASKVFSNFKELMGIFLRARQEARMKEMNATTTVSMVVTHCRPAEAVLFFGPSAAVGSRARRAAMSLRLFLVRAVLPTKV